MVASKKPAASKARSHDGYDDEDIELIRAGICMATKSEDTTMLASVGGLDIKIRGVVSTRCVSLDDAIGRGGFPLGRFTILHGREACGKTTLALQAIAEVQSMGGICQYIDAEHKLDLDYAIALGVNPKRLLLSQTNCLEDAFFIMDETVKMAAKLREKKGRRVPILVVLDSMNAAITKAQIAGLWDDMHMAPQARCFSSSLPKLIPSIAKEDIGLIFISQVRQKMNVQYGNDEEISGGKAPAFYASLIVHCKKVGTVKDGEKPVGSLTVAECKKNQVAPPFRKAQFVIVWGKGVDNERAIIELAAEKDVLTKKAGGYFFFGELKLGQGLGKCADYLRTHPETLEEIKNALRKLDGLSDAGSPYGEDSPEELKKAKALMASLDDDEEEEAPKPAKSKSKLNIKKMKSVR